MGDLDTNVINNVTLASEDGTKKAAINADGSLNVVTEATSASTVKIEDGGSSGNKAEVDANNRLLVSADALSSDEVLVQEFTRQTVSSHPTVLVSFTVPTGKEVVITSWHLATESAITLATLEAPAGTEVDAIRFNNSADTRRITVNYGNLGVVIATAGQVIQIETQSGDTSKEFISGFTGIQRDA